MDELTVVSMSRGPRDFPTESGSHTATVTKFVKALKLSLGHSVILARSPIVLSKGITKN